jgi:hypothetical protein
MATNVEIQKFVQRHHGFIPKTGWIAHVKEVHGIATLRGANPNPSWPWHRAVPARKA